MLLFFSILAQVFFQFCLEAYWRIVGDFVLLGSMLLFLIGLSAAQLFQVQLTSLRYAPGQFVVTGGTAARPGLESFVSPPRLGVRRRVRSEVNNSLL